MLWHPRSVGGGDIRVAGGGHPANKAD